MSGVRCFLASSSSSGNIIKSTDGGATWSNISTFAPTAAVLCKGPFWVGAGAGGVVRRSGDAASWSACTVPGGWVSGSGGAKRMVWNGSLFVVLPLGSYNKALTSPDGITFTERTLPFTAVWSGLAYSSTDAMWMAVSSSTGPVAVSSDGLTWTTAAAANYGVANDLAVIGSLWVATTVIANFGGIIWSIDKGGSWNRVAVGNHRVATAGWQRIIAADNRFVVAHATGGPLEFALSQRI